VEDGAYIVSLVAGVLYLPAAVFLLRLAARTGRLPERLLGLCFACMGVSYLLYQAPEALDLAAISVPFTVAGRLVYGAGCIAIAAFTRTVFRGGERWAGVAVWLCCALLVAGIAIGCATGDPLGVSFANPGFWLEWVAEMLPVAWLTAETFLQYGGARRRLRLGLCEPHVCNRFLLWGLFGTLQLGTGFAILWIYDAYAVLGHFSVAMDALLGGFEIASVAMIWLAFAPPAFYQRWIERRAPKPL
jgi:hypothetical protein